MPGEAGREAGRIAGREVGREAGRMAPFAPAVRYPSEPSHTKPMLLPRQLTKCVTASFRLPGRAFTCKSKGHRQEQIAAENQSPIPKISCAQIFTVYHHRAAPCA